MLGLLKPKGLNLSSVSTGGNPSPPFYVIMRIQSTEDVFEITKLLYMLSYSLYGQGVEEANLQTTVDPRKKTMQFSRKQTEMLPSKLCVFIPISGCFISHNINLLRILRLVCVCVCYKEYRWL